jgi:hypothetical protein
MRQINSKSTSGTEAAAKIDMLNAFLHFQLENARFKVRQAALGLSKASTQQQSVHRTAWACTLVSHQQELRSKAEALLKVATDPETIADTRGFLAKIETIPGLLSLSAEPSAKPGTGTAKATPAMGEAAALAVYGAAKRISVEYGRPERDVKRMLDEAMAGGKFLEAATGTVIDRILGWVG